MTSTQHYHAIPTNIITGFLGVGKTTAIQQLLRTQTERWAVLVNEFGEIGVDGSLLANSDSAQVFIKEVPGGCLCCAAGVPMQVALNQLLQQAKPTRLLIEPTGLGHPHEIISTLTHPPYKTALDLRATLTLVDARKIQDRRYTEHKTFQQQLQVADVVVAHKADTYGDAELVALQSYLAGLELATTPVYPVTQGKLNPAWLNLPRQALFAFGHFHPPSATDTADAMPLPTCGYVHKTNHGEGFVSQGWLFASRFVFDYAEIHRLFMQLPVVRLKAVVMTDNGVLAFNRIDNDCTCVPLAKAQDSRIEVLNFANIPSANLEAALFRCLLNSECVA